MKRAVWILAGLILVLLGIGALTAPGSILGKPLTTFVKEWPVTDGQLRVLQILSDEPVKVVFKESTDGSQSVYVKGQGPEKLAEAISNTQLEAGKLVVDLRYPNRRLSFDFGRPEEEVIVTLAPGYELDNLGVHIDTGSVDVSSISSRKAALTADSGSLKIARFEGGELQIEADSGSIELQDVKARFLKAEADSGAIQGRAIEADASFEADSGTIELDGMTGPIKMRTESGNIELIMADPSDADIKTESGNVRIFLPAAFAGSLDLKSDSGKITAPQARNESTSLIKVRTDSGRIEIEQEK